MNRWEWLEGLEAQSPIEIAVEQMAKLVVEELLAWPPRVEASDTSFRARFDALLAPGATRPSPAAFTEAVRCARWELDRNFDAIEFYERNNQRASACPEPRDQLASELIAHYILEAFFVLMEKTDYRVQRKDVSAGIDSVERQLAHAWNAV